ncbi:hypothetical protein QYF36_018703 [Acer negundo]|nr:hypothetical protein QYF36_018703 [Acer negundo]
MNKIFSNYEFGIKHIFKVERHLRYLKWPPFSSKWSCESTREVSRPACATSHRRTDAVVDMEIEYLEGRDHNKAG